jgi:hypothetical protein
MTNQDPSDYRDRKTGLVIFGILEIAMGCLFAMGMLLVGLGLVMSKGRSGSSPTQAAFAPAIVMYALLATSFIWLGIGSINARRWARAILLCFSAVALVGGVVACASMAFFLPQMFDAMAQAGPTPLQPAALQIIKVVTAVFTFLAYVVIPGALFLFYRSPNVKRTCEVRDPTERWTDRCPLPVLAYCLPLGIGGIAMLCVMPWFHALPVFGIVTSGGIGLLVTGFIAGVLLYLSHGFYQLKVGAWWIALGMLILGGVSSVVTFWSADLTDLYLKMGLDPRTAAMSANMMTQPSLKWMTVLSMLPWLLWLFWIRRYFAAASMPSEPKDNESP